MKPRTFILALLASLALVAPLTGSAQTSNVRGGVISTVQGSSFTLRNGTTVFLHQGTVINPTGANLEPNEVVTIIGSYDGAGRINADEVDIRGTATDSYVTPRTSGFYDANGVWHYGRAMNGFYDQNGNFHPMPAQMPAAGFYDQNGMFHPVTNGWYDVNGTWHPGSPNGFYYDPNDGTWHSY